MNRLRLRNRPGQSPAPAAARLESDRESLRFPEGGVFGSPDRPKTAHQVTRAVEQTLDRMQSQLDALSQEVDRVLHFPSDSTSGDWRPPHAA